MAYISSNLVNSELNIIIYWFIVTHTFHLKVAPGLALAKA
jgi:hypothetical protein